MERLTQAMQYIVGYIHYIINRTQTDSREPLLQPVRTFLDRYAFDGYTRIADAGIGIFHNDFDSRCFVFDMEALDRRALQFGRFPVPLQVGSQVASHTEMGSCIDAVRCDIDFEDIVALDIVVVFCRHPDLRFCREDDNARVVCPYTNLVFGTNHTVRLDATQLRAFDGEALVAVIELRADSGNNYLLSGSDIGCATDNL